jgi:TonB family protein
MPPSVKENEISAAKPGGAPRPGPTSTSLSDAVTKQQAVALEVPVTVNGARAAEGSDKREPFSESTKTVLIFGNGAVIRLSSSVAPGQLLFLTNERTKKEVVCQVVKSKNYRNVSGYVEMEFTEPVVGFWGMRFPSDRLGSTPQPVASAPVPRTTSASGSPAIPRPVASRVEAPAANVSASVNAPKPAAPVSVAKDAQPKLAEVPKLEELLPEKPVAPVAPLSSALTTSFDPEASLKLASATPPPAAPVLPVAPVNTIPEVPMIPPPVRPVVSEPADFDAPRASEVQASFLEPAKSPAAPLTTVPNLLSLFEAQPAAPSAEPEPPVQVCADPETEKLKRQTARLQELSNLMLSGEAAATETVSVRIPHAPAVEIQKELAESAAKILEVSHTSAPELESATPAKADKLDPLPTKSSFEEEELKIPAWLEPLARNAAAASPIKEPIEREKAEPFVEQPTVEEVSAGLATVVKEPLIPELPLPTFVDALPLDEEKNKRARRKSSRHGVQIVAFAAVVLALAGGAWWYITQYSGGARASGEPASTAEASVVSPPVESLHAQPQRNAPLPTNPPAQTNSPALTNASAQSKSSSNTLSIAPAGGSAAAASRSSQPSSSNPAKGAAAAVPVVEVVESPKKPVLGNVQLASPKVTQKRGAQNTGEADAVLVLNSEDQPESSAEGLNAGLAGGSNQPSAPVTALPVGGDVKQAKLIFSVAPVYPVLAKNQHVSGSVTIDALISAEGRVTTMKVVSGSALLQQAATDALKQWKYQPATLDGKPVAMHLTITLQFRLP